MNFKFNALVLSFIVFSVILLLYYLFFSVRVVPKAIFFMISFSVGVFIIYNTFDYYDIEPVIQFIKDSFV